jgi:uncharacterized membrane protein
MGRWNREHSSHDRHPTTDPLPPMAGTARPSFAPKPLTVGASGLVVAAALLWFLPWGVALVTGWDVAALTLLVREDENRGSATALLLGASVASLLGVGFALTLAGRESGALQVLLIGFAVLTIVVSWTVVNTVFALRYADLHFGSRSQGSRSATRLHPRSPHIATSPMSPSPSACVTRYPTTRSAIDGSGAPDCAAGRQDPCRRAGCQHCHGGSSGPTLVAAPNRMRPPQGPPTGSAVGITRPG